MNERWDLDKLYKGFDDPAFAADLTAFEDKVKAFISFTETLETVEAMDGLRKGIRLQEELMNIGDKLIAYPHFRSATDTKDAEAGSYLGRVLGIYSNTAGATTAFRQWACGIPNLMELVESDSVLKEYTFLFSNMVEMSRYQLGVEASKVAAKMELSGGEAWSNLQGYLTSTVPVSYRGNTTNLSAIRNLAYDADASVRKDAYEAEIACYEAIKEPVAHALNAIKLETISDCQLRGYESPLARTLKQSDMKRETLDAMLGAMDEYLPKFWQYLKAKAKALGHKNGLPWYDLFAPMGNASTKFTTEQTKDYLLAQFSGFDSELANMVAKAFDDAWIDFFPRDGKRGGAFCAGVLSIGESRILTNFDGMFTDVVTLAHELGRARCTHMGKLNPKRNVQGTPCASLG